MSKLDPDRRLFLMATVCAAVLPAAAFAADPYANSPWRRITDAEWKKRLPPESYEILRRDGTEQPWTSPLLKEHRKGTFVCLGCGLPLFRSEWKYDSGTGWPSFWTVIPGAVGKKADHLLPFEART
ncbi:MAG: peptide-methionine (R)-S-oxide reductase, partial [Alphaproteobacteria bacterium]|nr:peptide-methionine (R)-S-oxide reductase [Alphaproteobacteria bacterium]